MIERYYTFDVERFLLAHDENVRKLAELKAQKEAIADSGGMDYGHIRGSGISDPTAEKAQKRERIEWEIREIKAYLEAFDRLTADLSEEETAMLNFLTTPKYRRSFEGLKEALNYDRSATYNKLYAFKQKLRERADFVA